MLPARLQSKLIDLGRLLVDQRGAKVLIPPYASSGGYWFGGGNLAVDPGGDLYLVGRYRNEGDSRTGLAAGSRGFELAVFRSGDCGESFDKVLRLDKQDLCPNQDPGSPAATVLSIEGTALRFCGDRVELYVSTEKDGIGYPTAFADYLKPGTGVWSIDRLCASSVTGLSESEVQPLLASREPATIHVKDPFLYESSQGVWLFFCSHPFSWTCSGTGYLRINESTIDRASEEAVYDFFPRGNVWDVAMSRGTALVDVPKIGALAEHDLQLMFYDGGECVRDHSQHISSVCRARGHSCEELGGLAVFANRDWQRPCRLSRYEPLFVSPFGTGSSRYVDVLSRPEGMYVTWQQSQDDGSQPLMFRFVSRAEIERVLR